MSRMAQSSRSVLTPRDAEILVALGHQVSLLTRKQIQRAWWPTSTTPTACGRRLDMLLGQGWLRTMWVPLAVDVTVVRSPLAEWRPGESRPDLTGVIAAVRERATRPPWHSTTHEFVFVTTAAGAARVGGRTPRVRPSESAHDITLAEVFLWYRRTAPALARLWRCPDGHKGLGERVSDAVVARPGRPIEIEVVGTSYSHTKLMLFHEFCRSRGREYQLW